MLAALSYSLEGLHDFDREAPDLSLEYTNMFRNRANSQKPGDALYETFKKAYPEVRQTATISDLEGLGSSSAADENTQHYVPTSKPQYGFQDQQFAGSAEQMAHLEPLNLFSPLKTDEHGKDFDRTPRPLGEGWRFTPSILDPTSMNFANFNPQAYNASSPGAMNTIYHHQAGDLHTPKLNYGLGTPLSMPTSEGGVQTIPTVDAGDLPQTIHAHEFHNFHSFAPHRPFEPEGYPQQQDFEPMDHGMHSGIHPQQMQAEMPDETAIMGFRNAEQTQLLASPQAAASHNFKYHVTLNAPTAMIKHSDEIPITYLNKGQAYQLSILNTSPSPSRSSQRYRTFVRVSFQDEQQRERPAICWQLWKEGRGSNEAHQRGGKLQAVEFVEPVPTSEDDSLQPKIEVESASFDGFSVIWTPSPHGQQECTLSVRFNFLSTDFSHSKGVKGIPVRLCAKTELLGEGSPRSPASKAEICYCRVKLFRDHGAERKLSNDIAHVKKTIDKLHQQIAQIDAGMRDFGKKKRPSFGSKPPSAAKPGKVKHKRTWSMSSTSSAGGGGSAQRSVEEDLHLRLATMQDMFSSTRPVSVLALPGDPGDDPDLFPVQLTMDQMEATTSEPREGWDRRTNSVPAMPQTRASSLTSRSPSSASLQSHSGHGSMLHLTRHYSNQEQAEDWPMYQEPSSSMPDLTIASQKRITPPVKVQRRGQDQAGQLSGWIEAIDIDPSYQPPPEPVIKPVASFYIQHTVHGIPQSNNYYRAIYLYQRTLKDLVRAIANKCNVEPTAVIRTLHLRTPSMQVLVDDDVVQTMPEGQDMRVELNEIREDGPVRREWDTSEPAPLVDGEVDAPVHASVSRGWEMKLIY